MAKLFQVLQIAPVTALSFVALYRLLEAFPSEIPGFRLEVTWHISVWLPRNVFRSAAVVHAGYMDLSVFGCCIQGMLSVFSFLSFSFFLFFFSIGPEESCSSVAFLGFEKGSGGGVERDSDSQVRIEVASRCESLATKTGNAQVSTGKSRKTFHEGLRIWPYTGLTLASHGMGG